MIILCDGREGGFVVTLAARFWLGTKRGRVASEGGGGGVMVVPL